MRRNSDGTVVGDKFEFHRSSVEFLSNWLKEFDGTLRNGSIIAVDLPPAGLDGLRSALAEELAEAQKSKIDAGGHRIGQNE